MRTVSFYILVSLLISYSSQSQIVFQFDHAVAVDQCEMDPFGNFIYNTQQNQIVKYFLEGAYTRVYENPFLGKDIHIDASNPLRILVYYRDQSILIILDQLLYRSSQINLLDFNFFQVACVSNASDGNFWLYDPSLRNIIKIDAKGNTLFKSNDLSLTFHQAFEVEKIKEVNGNLYLQTDSLGVLVFDLFANFDTKIPTPDLQHFQVFEDELILFTSGDQFEIYNMATLVSKKISLPIPEDNQPARYFLFENEIYQVTSTEITKFPIPSN